MEDFKSWEEMSVLEQMQCQYWDMYKDAYNVRPRGIDTSSWTEDDFTSEFVFLSRLINANEVQRKESEADAVVVFEQRMKDLMEIGAKDRAMALRWIHEAEETNGDDEYLCFSVGLPYGYFKPKNVT
jgi:hypothetical protein